MRGGGRGEVAVLMQLDPTARPPGRPAHRPRHASARPTRRRLRVARAGERGPLWITARAPDRRPRPARPRLGLGARQSLRQPAADRSGAAERFAELSLRRRAGGARRGRAVARRACRAARAEMAERPADRRRQARRHPDRRRERRRRVVDRHRRQLRAPSGRHRRTRRPTSPTAGVRGHAGEPVRAAVGAR